MVRKTHFVILICYTVVEIKRKEMLAMMYINRIADRNAETMEVLLI